MFRKCKHPEWIKNGRQGERPTRDSAYVVDDKFPIVTLLFTSDYEASQILEKEAHNV